MTSTNLSRSLRDNTNADLRGNGFCGNGRFQSLGFALGEIAGVLAERGLEIAEVFTANSHKSGRAVVAVAASNADNPFCPTPLDNTALVIEWMEMRGGNWPAYEVVSYLG